MATMEKIVNLDGKEYLVRQLPPTKALKLLSKLIRLLGVPFVTMAGADASSTAERMPKALAALVAQLDDDQAAGLFKELMNAVIYERQTLDQTFEAHFIGKLGDLMKLAKEVIAWNFEDFLSVLADSVPAQTAPVVIPE